MSGSTSKGVLRHLRHLMPAPTGAAGKFATSRMPRQAQAQPAFVPPKDRIAFWNIVPGDRVRLRKGKVLGKDDAGRDVKGEGIVTTIDRERNLVWIRNEESPHLNPTIGLRHITPRLNDPEEGPEKGFSPNRMEVAKPVHYSNLILRLPDDIELPDELKKSLDAKAGIYTSRITRSSVRYDKAKGMFIWTRYAMLRDDEGDTYKVEVPWPKKEGRSRTITPLHSSANIVTTESWLPWSPSDPVHMPTERFRTSPHSEARYAALVADRQARGLPVGDAQLHWATTMSAAAGGADVVGLDGEMSEDLGSSSSLDDALSALDLGEAPAPSVDDRLPRRQGTYAGFEVRRTIKPPPIAQAPTAAEKLWIRKAIQADWARDVELKDHARKGGMSFAASDYLDLTPAEGPAAGGDWNMPPPPAIVDAEGNDVDDVAGLRTARDVRDGKLLRAEGGGKAASLMEMDTWPIELLMSKELTNEAGLAKRMKRWSARREMVEERARLVKEEERKSAMAARRWGEERLEKRRREEQRERESVEAEVKRP